jgi:hypothetical protein
VLVSAILFGISCNFPQSVQENDVLGIEVDFKFMVWISFRTFDVCVKIQIQESMMQYGIPLHCERCLELHVHIFIT